MYTLYNKIEKYTTGEYQISKTGSLYHNSACSAIMIGTSVTGTGSFVDGGMINLNELSNKTIYPFRLSWIKVDSGAVYLLY